MQYKVVKQEMNDGMSPNMFHLVFPYIYIKVFI